jgi:hypothetical protein
MRIAIKSALNSKGLLAVLCLMLVAESGAYYKIHQYHNHLLKEKQMLMQHTNKWIKARHRGIPDSHKGLQI